MRSQFLLTISQLLHALLTLSQSEEAEGLARLMIWLGFHVFIGLLPVVLSWWLVKLDPKLINHKRDFYWEGAFLFLGPAIVGALCAELTISHKLLADQVLSVITLSVMAFVSFSSAVTYSFMLTKIEASEAEPMTTIIKEVSDGILISSAAFAFSVTAVLYGGK